MFNDFYDEFCSKGHIEHTVQLRAELRICDEAFKPGNVRVHLPVPISCRQLACGRILDFSPVPQIVSLETYPQRTAYFEEELERNDSFFVEYAFENVFDYVQPDFDAAHEQNIISWEQTQHKAAPSCGCHSYLEAEDMLTASDFISDESVFQNRVKLSGQDKTFADSLRDTEKNPLKRAWKVYEYVTKKDVDGLENLYFVLLCRRAFVCTRWQGGLNTCGINNEICESDWVQYYIEPYGFIFADCHMGRYARLQGDEKMYNFYFSNIDPYRVPLAADYGAQFYPPKEYERAHPYTNWCGEAEYDGRGLREDEYRTTFFTR